MSLSSVATGVAYGTTFTVLYVTASTALSLYRLQPPPGTDPVLYLASGEKRTLGAITV